MSKNVEIKARLTESQFAKTGQFAASISDSGPTPLRQRDTFFHSKEGRLKLREFGVDDARAFKPNGSAELIFYRRPDQGGPKVSDYLLIPCQTPSKTRLALELSNGIRGVVEKRRTLFKVGPTRIHLDQVESLGTFLELEVVLSDGESIATGTETAKRLMNQLQVAPTSLIESAYIDLLLQRQTQVDDHADR